MDGAKSNLEGGGWAKIEPLYAQEIILKADRLFSNDVLFLSEKGVTIQGSGKVELSRREFRTLTRIIVRVREGRHHLIQRLLASVGVTVVRASRRSFGPVLLGSLKRGAFRYLTSNEIKALKRSVKRSEN